MAKKISIILVIGCAIAMVMVAGLNSAALAVGIVDSYHNLSPGTNATIPVGPARVITGDFNEICVYCHTPHGGQTAAPLWNRNFNNGSYTLYNSATLDSTLAQPGGVSKACLSCHDGTISINALINAPGTGSGSAGTDVRIGNTAGANDMALIGTDLRNDHPIGMTYTSAAGGPKSPGIGTNTIGDDSFTSGFRPTVTSGTRTWVDGTNAFNGAPTTGIKLPLYSVKVECTTCHDPHEVRTKAADQVFFLRASNAGSNLCRTCHLK